MICSIQKYRLMASMCQRSLLYRYRYPLLMLNWLRGVVYLCLRVICATIDHGVLSASSPSNNGLFLPYVLPVLLSFSSWCVCPFAVHPLQLRVYPGWISKYQDIYPLGFCFSCTSSLETRHMSLSLAVSKASVIDISVYLFFIQDLYLS